ncbi:ABC transporter ATP-binding protein [Halanaerobium hydrogeniformans]|uniref:ABC transporter related protein n=1 Tax=Halanaerobium hydrogeniformans TaxID=656519 RepID=E4RLZ9_HALHG|nr:ABC transporter ATP-binding protein [Halanaerobium hydrogeniformans]ADQ14082.1 ABC transporter related protein [Halanaerobium hydrogeniformans]
MQQTLKKLWELFNKKEKKQILILFIAVLTMALAQIIGIASIMPFMDLVMSPDMIEESRALQSIYNFLGFQSITAFTIFIGTVMFSLILLSNAISTFASWYKLKFVWENNHRLSRRLLKKYMSKPYSYFLMHNTADLGKNVLHEVYALTINYLIQLIDLITYSIVALAIIILLFLTDLLITSAAIIILGSSYILIYLATKNKMKTAGEKRLEANMNRYKTAYEAFNGIKEIKVNSRENEFLNRYTHYSAKNAKLQAWNQIIRQMPRYVMEALAFGSVVLLVLYFVIRGEDSTQLISKVSLFAFAGYRLLPALQSIFNSASSMVFNTAILDRIHEDIFEAGKFAAQKWPDSLPEPMEFRESLKLKNITFSYHEQGEKILKNINIEIRKDSQIGLAGETGSGKSTLVNIILGLLESDQGKIIVDGRELNRDNIRNWQRNIGYVPQDIYLCDNTIVKNIAFGVPEAEIDFKAVKRAAQIANIADFIENELEKGYQSIVGERGIRISGGQKQRLGLARALYHDPEILILDEATSSLDEATQKAVMEAIDKIAEVKTMIIIAHRLSTVQNCDKIYLIEKGQIIDSGNYAELANNSQKFRKLADINSQL